MSGVRITKYDLELVAASRVFLDAAAQSAESRAVLERYGFVSAEQERGAHLVGEAERAFEWERQGRAYNFLSPTPERRAIEARGWYADTRRRYMRACLRRAEEATGWVGTQEASRWPFWRKVTLGTLAGLRHAASAASPRAWSEHRAGLRASLARASGPKPADAPPPKDTALVELAGWYERWRLLAHRVFRQRPDLLAPYGLTPGKAPPRLRGKGAAKYGERAAGSLNGHGAVETVQADGNDEDDALADPDAAPAARAQRLPVVS
jgi:hypothetical protein